MKKSEIKNGAILKTRNGMCWFKVDDTLLEVNVKTGVGYNYMPWDEYDEDMKYYNTVYDVIGVDNDVDNERGNCNKALGNFLLEKTVFTKINQNPTVTKEVYYILKFLLEVTSFEYIAKDGDGTHEVYLYKYEPKKISELSAGKSGWYWAPTSVENGAIPNVSDLFKSEEMKTFFNSLNPNRVYKIEDLISSNNQKNEDVINTIKCLYENTPYVFLAKDYDGEVIAYQHKPNLNHNEEGEPYWTASVNVDNEEFSLPTLFNSDEMREFYKSFNCEKCYLLEDFLKE